MVQFVSLVFIMSATEIVSVGIELISFVGFFADVYFMIILRLVVPKTLNDFDTSLKMFPYAHLLRKTHFQTLLAQLIRWQNSVLSERLFTCYWMNALYKIQV